ncbi:MAG: phenylalanine--tRNA ligase subunit beta [Succinivibrio sp.]|nr:phenylalanine--tRNA ligase subunit beta [Succinivibrio sp.]
MKVTKLWLDEWVPNKLSAEDAAEKLTMAGLEVDSLSAPCGEFSKVVVGKVLECWPHPDSDHMHVTKVDAGTGEILQVVCGAPNCREGLKVCVALEGAQVGDLKITKAQKRGVESAGMLCSYKELGMAEESDGIIELPEDAPLGVDVHEYLKLDDRIIDIDLTANRADCLGVCGIARELAVLTGQSLRYPQVTPVPAAIEEIFPVQLNAPQACPRYLDRVIRGVNQKAKSPLWLTERLRRAGLRSVSPIVDVTNYVMLEYSQPLHSFDLNKLHDHIVVRMAGEGEKLTVLSGEELSLKSNTLVIADSQGPVALAGIFGGLNSGISDETTDVLLESAFFSPDAIKGRARQYGLDTDAAHRYERGVDHDNQRRAMERATALLIEIAGGSAGPVNEALCAEQLPQHAPIELRYAKLSKVLGEEVPQQRVFEILEQLELHPQQTDLGVRCVSPSFRFDLGIEEDLIEEVARIYGYDVIPNAKACSELRMLPRREERLSELTLRQKMCDLGYFEAITYSFVHPDHTKVFSALPPVMLTTPISPEMSAMRTSLLAGLSQAALYNLNRQQKRVRLFEIGLTYLGDKHAENGVRQELSLAAIATGEAHPENWGHQARAVDFFDVKGDVEELLSLTCRDDVDFVPSKEPFLHPGQGADILLGGQRIGAVGMLHPLALKALGLKGNAAVLQLKLEALLDRKLPVYQALSRYPSVRRDLAFLLPKSVSVKELSELLHERGGALVQELRVFDVFEDEKLGDRRSVAVGLTLQNKEATLQDAEVGALVESLIAAAQERLGAVLRA